MEEFAVFWCYGAWGPRIRTTATKVRTHLGVLFEQRKSFLNGWKHFCILKMVCWQKLQKCFGWDLKALWVVLEEALERCFFLKVLQDKNKGSTWLPLMKLLKCRRYSYLFIFKCQNTLSLFSLSYSLFFFFLLIFPSFSPSLILSAWNCNSLQTNGDQK